MNIRLDKVVHSSLHEAYKNYKTSPGTIIVPADNIPNGVTNNYSTTIPYTRGGTRADIYAQAGSLKTLATIGSRVAGQAVYTSVSTETASLLVGYTAANITATLSISNNSGGAIVLTPQNINVIVVQYDAPITSI